jgi:predicted phosphodiesterase
LEVEKKIILVIHDLWGNPKRLEGINKKQVDIIVHGHSHKATIQKEEKVLIINPGSPIASVYSGRTVGLLYLTSNNIEGEIIELR